MTEIKVTGCHDCKSFKYYDRGADFYYCILLDCIVQKYCDKGTLHPSCPLKQGPITIKLEKQKEEL